MEFEVRDVVKMSHIFLADINKELKSFSESERRSKDFLDIARAQKIVEVIFIQKNQEILKVLEGFSLERILNGIHATSQMNPRLEEDYVNNTAVIISFIKKNIKQGVRVLNLNAGANLNTVA